MSEAEPHVLWTPDAERVAASRMAAFARAAGFAPEDAAGLHAWSVNEPEAFHGLLWDELGIVGERGETIMRSGATIRDVRFFPEARLNYAENALAEPDDRPAIIAHRDDGVRRTLSRAELYTLVSRIAQGLGAEGVGPGDRVAGLVTNDIEAVAFYLASAAIGAVWASCSPDFGPAGASDRLGQVAPKVLVAVAGYQYGGKRFDVSASIAAVAAAESVRRIVVIGEGGGYGKPSATLEDWLAPYAPGPIAFHRQAFDAPMAILFSSGTTGRPKGIIHSGGGLLVQHLKEQVLHCDLVAGDRLFFYSTCGWMMWNWLVSGLAAKATIVTYDGNPAYPGIERMAELIEAEQITIFGTSARYLDSCRKAGFAPAEGACSLQSLKAILSTGSPLLAPNFDYVYARWKADVHLASISGGTDICGCFLGGNPTLPVRRGEIQGPMLGMDVGVLGPDGEQVFDVAGELVCGNAHVSMPFGFWDDSDGSRYRAAYFERFPDVWAHGDFAEERASGGFVIHGRSDTTLNPAGVRIGTAEIYRQIETVAEVAEAVAVAQEWQGDQRVILFVTMSAGHELTDELEQRIRSGIRAGATPRHVPALVIAVPEIPRTRSGKISEIAVRDAIHGRRVDNDGALANPESLKAFRGLRQLRPD